MNEISGEKPIEESSKVPIAQPAIGQSSTMSDVPEQTPRRFPKVAVLIVLLLMTAAGGILGFLSLRQPQTQKTISTPPLDSTPVQPTPEPATHYVGSHTAVLRDVRGGTLSGRATREISTSYTLHTVNAALPDPEGGAIYQAWIVKDNEFFPIGTLTNNGQGRYVLRSDHQFPPGNPPFPLDTTFEDLRNTVVVTLETTNDDVAETKILEGTFTQ